MQEAKHLEVLAEIDETVREALAGDLRQHQRRLAAMLSLGVQQLAELFLHRRRVIKPGVQIKHEWFKLGGRNLRLRLAAALTVPPEQVEGLNEVLGLARDIEEGRDDLLYGSPLTSDALLREKVGSYLELKQLVLPGRFVIDSTMSFTVGKVKEP